ncbi:MAG: peptidase M23 [Pseudomonadota bacterium]
MALPPVASAEEAADRARLALAAIDEATAGLDQAETGRDRVKALTDVIVALENGLSALRGSVRDVSARSAELQARLTVQEDEVAALLQALLRVGGTGSPVVHLHPAGALGTVRAGLLVADIAPALDARAGYLRDDLEELAQLRSLQADASAALDLALRDLRSARANLNEAIANRKNLPQRFQKDPVREAILLSSADTLAQFVSGLDEMSATPLAAAPIEMAGQKGALPLPVRGSILRGADEADAAGVRRPGLLVQTAPEALVVSPVAASLRYVGPLLDFGNVVILEPQADLLFVLAGLDVVYGTTGDLINAGEPLGLMAAEQDKSAAVVSTDSDGAGTAGPETLYIEVRENNTTQDPNLWFDTDKDG